MKRPSLSFTVMSASAAMALAACGSLPPHEVLAPPAELVTQGIPPVPAALVSQVAKYTDFRGHAFADWHPTRREMLVTHRQGNTTQVFRLSGALQAPEPLTDGADPVTTASFEPTHGEYLVFERSAGGSEANQLYRLDLATRQTTRLTDPGERHDFGGWLHRSARVIVASLPLDKSAQGGTRSRVSTTLRLLDPTDPAATRTLAELDGGGWYASGVSTDDRHLALTRYLSATESQVWLMDLATGATTQLLPAPGSTERATHFAAGFLPGGAGLYVISDRAGEFRELMAYRIADRSLVRMSAHIPWDVRSATVSDDGRRVAALLNVDGRQELHLFDGDTLKPLPAPALPPGSLGSASFHKRSGELAFTLNSAQGPSQLHTLDAQGRVHPWTRPHAPPGVDMASFPDPSIVRWTSFDGRTISGLLNRPPARFTGKRPVLVLIHGGPESQATVGFLGRYNYFVNELGIAILQPNVRGSSGYGKSFLALDDGRKREDAVKDIGALLDWIATQPGLDPARVVVGGGSYGGYMSLAVATHYAERIAGTIDIVGISNFVTFLQNTESYRRDLRRVEYGDERDPAMRAFLEGISPLTNAHRITKPLFVVQGRNDPRVPYTEAEQIVAKARANGTPVWYLRAENEGHGFARKDNADFQFYATILFLQKTMGR
jgi:dipeptidyl aminopeptidase/acylaminoacyl peptidase